MTTKKIKLDYRYWDGKKDFWRYARKFFATPEDAEEFVTDHGLTKAEHKYTIEPISSPRD